jgi:prefoldin subunit 5
MSKFNYEQRALDSAIEIYNRFEELTAAFNKCETAVADLKDRIRQLAMHKAEVIVDEQEFAVISHEVAVNGAAIRPHSEDIRALMRKNSVSLFGIRFQCGRLSEQMQQLDYYRKSTQHLINNLMTAADEEFGEILKELFEAANEEDAD